MLSPILILLLSGRPSLPAISPKLLVGSPAPNLHVQQWVRGQPVTHLRQGQLYLVEFWATWCQPCLTSAAHLSELKRKYGPRGLNVVGITHLDRWGSTRKSITDLVKKMGKRMDYSIGIDRESPNPYQTVFSGKTEVAYLRGAEVQAIPCVFLIDRSGTIAYIGMPSLVDSTLESLIDGSFDLERAASEYLKAKQTESRLDGFLNLLRKGRTKEAYALGWEMVENSADARTQWLMSDAIVSTKGLADRDLRLALVCGETAVKASRGREPAMLATLAGVHYHLGNREETKKLMRAAMAVAILDQKSSMRRVAKRYGVDD